VQLLLPGKTKVGWHKVRTAGTLGVEGWLEGVHWDQSFFMKAKALAGREVLLPPASRLPSAEKSAPGQPAAPPEAAKAPTAPAASQYDPSLPAFPQTVYPPGLYAI